ncbi:MAG: hypothetical protein HY423_06145 [Candidatus Lambdaproteobacteria bacterium]|nr:hypothetical protein [Candidatus Lambdaproteobacteria bacterium]
MSQWIRFRFEQGETMLFSADQVHVVFKPDDLRIEVYPPVAPAQKREGLAQPICVFACETPDQVSAAEELIFDTLADGQSVTVSLDVLDDHAEYLNHVNGIRTILQLLHEGRIRIPVDEDFNERELFDPDKPKHESEIGQFEEMLNTYLDVPGDTLRRAFANEGGDSPFQLLRDHEECADHGFHEYWVVATRPDRHYAFRHDYESLVKAVVEKEGLDLQKGPPA